MGLIWETMFYYTIGTLFYAVYSKEKTLCRHCTLTRWNVGMLANIDVGMLKICVGNMKMCVGNQILEVTCPRAI